MANACILFLHRIYLLTMLPQSGIVTIVDSVDEVRENVGLSLLRSCA